MTKNLFIVESPFQFLSAIEANYYLKGEQNILIIKYSSYKTHAKNNEQMHLLKELITWDEIVEIENSFSTKQSNLKLLLLIKKIKKSFHKIDKIFIGEYRSWVAREYLNILNPRKCFVLDDGNMAIELQNSYIPYGKYYYFGSNIWKRSFDKLLHSIFTSMIFRKKYKTRTDLNLFTCFDLEPYSKSQSVIKHSFEYLKIQNKKKVLLNNIAYFFGGNISELNLMTESDELAELKKVQRYFESRNIQMIYLPHRRESDEKLLKISSTLGIDFSYSQYPAEIEFILMRELPEYLSSFMSTALYTVSQISTFKEIIAFKLPYEKINQIYLDDTKSLYEGYKKTMKVLEFYD